jgi:hypothetical protein
LGCGGSEGASLVDSEELTKVEVDARGGDGS